MAGSAFFVEATDAACEPLDARLALDREVDQRVFTTGAFDGVPRTGGSGGGGLSISRTCKALVSSGSGGGGRSS